jgi:hypothetical protein
MILDDDEAEFLVRCRDVVRELGTLGLARIECWNGVRHGQGYCAYRLRDVEVGYAGWEIPGPQRSFAVCQRHFDGSP